MDVRQYLSDTGQTIEVKILSQVQGGYPSCGVACGLWYQCCSYVFVVQGMSLIYLGVDLLLEQASAKLGSSSITLE